jgi:hypothetical protein
MSGRLALVVDTKGTVHIAPIMPLLERALPHISD